MKARSSKSSIECAKVRTHTCVNENIIKRRSSRVNAPLSENDRVFEIWVFDAFVLPLGQAQEHLLVRRNHEGIYTQHKTTCNNTYRRHMSHHTHAINVQKLACCSFSSKDTGSQRHTPPHTTWHKINLRRWRRNKRDISATRGAQKLCIGKIANPFTMTFGPPPSQVQVNATYFPKRTSTFIK